MPKVVKEELDQLNAVLTIHIGREDYKPRFDEELKKYRQKAQLKGFRKGKTPLSFIKKMYGQSVLVDIVNTMLQEEMSNFMRDDESKFLGQPIPSEDQPSVNFDALELEDFTFKFDLGIAPEFELKGVDAENTFKEYAVEIPEEEIGKELEMAQKQTGERKETEEQIEENDVISVHAVELDGDAPKEGGWESTFSLHVESVSNEELKSELLKKKKGDTIRINIHNIEDSEIENYAQKHFLNMSEEEIEEQEVGEMFEGTIQSVTRLYPSELNQEFFDKAFGPDQVSSEEEAREKIRENIQNFYQRQVDGLLFRDFQDDLMEKNKEQLPLPDSFLKRWLVQANEKNTPEQVEKEYDKFAESLRWSLIKGKLTRQFEIQITEEQIREGFIQRVAGYFGGQVDPSLIGGTVDRLMQDEQQVESVAEEIVSDLLFEKIKESVTIEPAPISAEELKEMVQKAREEAAAATEPAAEEEE
jgi:trigger factor